MKRIMLVVLLALSLVTMTAASAQSSDTLIWSLAGGDISTLNRALVTDSNSFAVINSLFSGLYQLNPDTAIPEPDLTSWEVSEDGKTYTFTIRPDANWSDGTPITSKDVKFTYDAILSDQVESPHKGSFAAVESVDIIDDKTFNVVLKQVDCTVFGDLTGLGNLVPLPSHLYAADFSDFMTNPNNLAPSVVSGPYQFAERSAGEFVRLTANPSYYAGTPKIPNLLYRIIADSTTIPQALETNTIDYAFMLPDLFAQLADPSAFSVFQYPANIAPFAIMNYQDSENPQNAYDADGNPVELVPNKFFADKRVRQAVAMGYNKLDVALTLGDSAGSVPLTGPITPAFYGAYNFSDLPYYEYNPERAAELLEEAGWVDSNGNGVRDKDGLEFEVDLIYSNILELFPNAALIMQDQLGQIGIKINLVQQEWSAYLTNVLLPGKYDLTVVSFGGGAQVDATAYSLLYSRNIVLGGGGFNLAAYVNPEMDRLLDEGRQVPGCDVAERSRIYREVQRIAMEDVAYDWMVSSPQVHVLNPRVTDAFIGQWGFTRDQLIGWGLGD